MAGRVLQSLNHAACQFASGVAGWLTAKIIWLVMQDDGTAQNYLRGESCRIISCPGIAVPGKNDRQISDMIGMQLPLAMKMPFGIGKVRSAAVGSFMDMQGVEVFRFRQVKKFCYD